MLGGSPYGAVLHLIPERDAVPQVQLQLQWLQRRLGARVRGAWLPQGAWDGAVPRLLARVGLQFTFLDEALMLAGGCPDTDGWSVVEREGAAIGIFPVDARLSALLPWGPPRHIAQELQRRARAGAQCMVASVSGEELGLAPHSARWCWDARKGWVRRLFRMLEQQDHWLQTVLPSTALDRWRPSGRAAPLAGTSAAVGSAIFDVETARAFDAMHLVALKREADTGVRLARRLAGPPWEGFLVRYDEANRLHKRMLRVSLSVLNLRRMLRERGETDLGGPSALAALERARRDLYRGQGAAAPHAGPGGGLYRGDVRHAAWAALLRAEEAVRTSLGQADSLSVEVADLDCDGQREVLISTPFLQCVLRPAGGGALVELNAWGVGNLANTLTRREELWHEDLAQASALPALVEEDETEPFDPVAEDRDQTASDDPELELSDPTDPVFQTGQTSGTDTVHAVGVRGARGEAPPLPLPPAMPPLDPGLDRLLHTDRHRRGIFQEHFLGRQVTLDNLDRGQYPELGDFLDGAYTLLNHDDRDPEEIVVSLARDGVLVEVDTQRLLRVTKRLRFARRYPTIDVSYELSNRSPEPISALFAVEINLNLDSVRGEDRWIGVPGEGVWPLDARLDLPDVSVVDFVLADHVRCVRIVPGTSARLLHLPIETPVRTWMGYKAGYQGAALLLAWELSLWGGEKQRFEVSLSVEGA